MKLKIISVLVITLLTCPQLGFAGAYTIPKTYADGDTLMHTDLNNENTAIKAAVDDNNTRIIALEAISGSTQQLSVGYFEFNPWWGNENDCHRSPFSSGSYYYLNTTTNTNCDAFAIIHIPNGATITNLSCTVYDNYAGASISASILTRGVSGQFLTTDTSIDSTSNQTLTSGVQTHVVDTTTRSYAIFINSSSSNLTGVDLRLESCIISYTVKV